MSTATAKFTPVDHVKDARTKKKTRQAFYTPLTLVKTMVETCPRVYAGGLGLEPSAGDGRIVHAMVEAGLRVEACEIEPDMAARCERLGARMVGADFLQYRAPGRYDVILMNPPFTRGQAKKHIEHAYPMLRPGGELVSVAPWDMAETLRDGGLELPGCEYATYEPLSPDTFKESGASVKTVLVTIGAPDAEPREVEGFCNWATYNAAMTISSDPALLRRAHKTSDIRDDAGILAALAACGGWYGVFWPEVHEYVRQFTPGEDLPPAIVEPPPKPKAVRPRVRVVEDWGCYVEAGGGI